MSATDTINRLVHDVAKYICRAAQNWDDSMLEVLHPMLMTDLYGGPPSMRVQFTRLVEKLPSDLQGNQLISDCRLRFAELAELESKVADGDLAACNQAVVHAREIKKNLRLFKEQTVDSSHP